MSKVVLKVKELREAAGLTQVELAQKMGVAQNSISTWETETALPKTSMLFKLAKALGVTVGDLFENEEASA